MNAPARTASILDAAEPTWTADEFADAIAEAFHDSNDVDGPHWPSVARSLAETIAFPLADQTGVRPLDLIWEAVNALGGYVDPRDAAAVAGEKRIADALALIERLGGRDPAPIQAAQASRSLAAVAHQRGQAVLADLYRQTA